MFIGLETRLVCWATRCRRVIYWFRLFELRYVLKPSESLAYGSILWLSLSFSYILIVPFVTTRMPPHPSTNTPSLTPATGTPHPLRRSSCSSTSALRNYAQTRRKSAWTLSQPQTAPHTPRKRRVPKQPASNVGTSHLKGLTTDDIRAQMIAVFKLKFEPDDWQLEIIKCIHEGSDSILIAGTGYGKSCIFESLALLGASERKAVLVICPLKTLEYDQVSTYFF